MLNIFFNSIFKNRKKENICNYITISRKILIIFLKGFLYTRDIDDFEMIKRKKNE